MKVTIVIFFMALSVMASDFYTVDFACTDDVFLAHQSKVVDGLSYPMFRSDFQTAYMTNGVLWAFNFRSRCQLNSESENVYTWSVSIPKAQALSDSDVTYISNKMSVAGTRFRYGVNSGRKAWLNTFSKVKDATPTNTIPVERSLFSGKNMQNDALWFVTACTEGGWDADRVDWCDNWCDLRGWEHTEANRVKVESYLNKDTYVLTANTNVAIWVLQKNIKALPYATLSQRDVFRSNIAAQFRPTVGFLRNSQKQVYMDKFGIQKREQ